MRCALLLALVLVSCAHGATRSDDRSLTATAPLAIRAVDWNPARVAVGRLVAIIDNGEQLAALSEHATTLLHAGAMLGSESRTLVGGAAIPAADGAGTWLVALDGAGHLRRLRAGAPSEDIGDRYGLAHERVRALCAAGTSQVAFALDDELVVADGQRVRRYPLPNVGARIACGGGRVAVLGAKEVRLVSIENGALATLPRKADAAAFDISGRLIVLTDRAIYVEVEPGRLVLRHVSAAPLHGLARAGALVWFRAGSELGIVDGDEVAVTSGARLGAKVRLFGTPSGDVWVLDPGQLRRYAREDAALSPDDRWALLVAPIFSRSCHACHLPNGPAAFDLSTASAWGAARDAIRDRVVDKRDMPPADHPLADRDRATIAAWLAQ